MISVLVPTTGRRKTMLEQTMRAYRRITDLSQSVEFLPISGYSWGEGLNRLMAVAQGEYILCACDDKTPWKGWFEAARTYLDARIIPASRNFNVDGTPVHEQYDTEPHDTPTNWTRDFLLTPAIYEEVGPFIDTTWYADLDYCKRLIDAGYELRRCEGFRFTHLAGERDWQTPQESARERDVYRKATTSA